MRGIVNGDPVFRFIEGEGSPESYPSSLSVSPSSSRSRGLLRFSLRAVLGHITETKAHLTPKQRVQGRVEISWGHTCNEFNCFPRHYSCAGFLLFARFPSSSPTVFFVVYLPVFFSFRFSLSLSLLLFYYNTVIDLWEDNIYQILAGIKASDENDNAKFLFEVLKFQYPFICISSTTSNCVYHCSKYLLYRKILALYIVWLTIFSIVEAIFFVFVHIIAINNKKIARIKVRKVYCHHFRPRLYMNT